MSIGFVSLALYGLITLAPPQTHNLIRNGDFEEGNRGFVSGLTYTQPTYNCLWPEGFTVTSGFNKPQVLHMSHPDWDLVAPKGGNCLFANPSERGRDLLWQQVVKCKPATNYHISFCVASIRPQPEWAAKYYIDVNGDTSDLQDPGLLAWKTVSYDWNSQSDSSARVTIYCPPQLHRRALCGISNVTMIEVPVRNRA